MMKPCRDIELELPAYCTGELTGAEHEQVQAHLDACSVCRDELAREMSLRHTLGSLPTVRAPRDLDRRIMAQVGKDSRRPWWNRRSVRLAVASLAAACLAVAFLVPSLRHLPAAEPAWTQEEMAAARQDIAYTLALTAEVINRSQKETMVDVFADRLPNAINASFKKVKLTNTGGNG